MSSAKHTKTEHKSAASLFAQLRLSVGDLGLSMDIQSRVQSLLPTTTYNNDEMSRKPETTYITNIDPYSTKLSDLGISMDTQSRVQSLLPTTTYTTNVTSRKPATTYITNIESEPSEGKK